MFLAKYHYLDCERLVEVFKSMIVVAHIAISRTQVVVGRGHIEMFLAKHFCVTGDTLVEAFLGFVVVAE